MAKNTTAQTHEINTGMDMKQRDGVVSILNRVLANQHVLYTKTRNYHWNVTGRLFFSLHTLLEEQYTALAMASDEVAERVRSLGGHPIGTMQEFIDCSMLKEQPGDVPGAMTMVGNLVEDHEGVIRGLRDDVDACEELNDVGTADFLTAQLEAHEKMAWMLRAFLEDHE